MGMWGQVEGSTKVATWLAFKKVFRDKQDGGLDHVGRPTYHGGFYLDFPRRKREAYRRMEPKPDGTGWVLHYRLNS